MERIVRVGVALGMLGAGTGLAAAHGSAYLTFVNAASNAIQVEYDWKDALMLDEQNPEFPGWSSDHLSFEEIINDRNDPHWDESMAFLASGSKVQIVFTGFDAGVYAYDGLDHATAFSSPGDSFSLGNGTTNFERQIIWRVDPDAPGFDAGAGVWNASFYLRDASGQHGDSEVYTMPLTIAPAPGSLALLGAAGLMGRRRRM